MSEAPLMPKATAIWLVENTALSFDQIAAYCQLHALEVKGIADGEVNPGMTGLNPLLNNQLTKEEIARCEADPDARLSMKRVDLPQIVVRSKGPRYTPVTKRGDKPDAIAWILKTHPELSDGQIVRLIGTTKNTIDKIRDRAHWNIANIKPRDPVFLGLCKQSDLNAAVEKARKANPEKVPAPAPVAEPMSGLADPFAPANDRPSFSDDDQPSDEGYQKMMEDKLLGR
jgi:hypothetical protein